MENMKSLADQLREELVRPDKKPVAPPAEKKSQAAAAVGRKEQKKPEYPLLKLMLDYDNSRNKSMVHVRFDEKTVQLMNRFKMATDVDLSRFVAFAVKHFFDTSPELKQIIKHFIQNTEL
jgi:ethanolamine ammonia-lyase small subunit